MSGEVPPHLYGATQHKTLGARLSEDILRYRKRSRFFRTRPGRFFLREFIGDRSIPLEFRTPIVATRRRRQLRRKNVAAVDRDYLLASNQKNFRTLSPETFAKIVRAGAVRYVNLDTCPAGLLPVHSYVIIRRGDQILLHTKGSYAESRPGYVSKEMLGFPIPLCHDDLTLFDVDDHGLVAAGLTGVANDLDLEFSADFPSFELSAELRCLVPILTDSEEPALVGVVSVEAPLNLSQSVDDLPLATLSGDQPVSGGQSCDSIPGRGQFWLIYLLSWSHDSCERAPVHFGGGAIPSSPVKSG